MQNPNTSQDSQHQGLGKEKTLDNTTEKKHVKLPVPGPSRKRKLIEESENTEVDHANKTKLTKRRGATFLKEALNKTSESVNTKWILRPTKDLNGEEAELKGIIQAVLEAEDVKNNSANKTIIAYRNLGEVLNEQGYQLIGESKSSRMHILGSRIRFISNMTVDQTRHIFRRARVAYSVFRLVPDEAITRLEGFSMTALVRKWSVDEIERWDEMLDDDEGNIEYQIPFWRKSLKF